MIHSQGQTRQSLLDKKPSTSWKMISSSLHIQNPIERFYRIVYHYSDIIMSVMASKIISLMIVYSTVYSGTAQRKHQSSASLAFVRGIHRWPVNSPHRGPVTRESFHWMTSSCSQRFGCPNFGLVVLNRLEMCVSFGVYTYFTRGHALTSMMARKLW